MSDQPCIVAACCRRYSCKPHNRTGRAWSAGFQVVFLWTNDWVPLGTLNDVEAVQNQDSQRRLVTVTLLQSVPWTLGLCFCLTHLGRFYPDWLYSWLLVSCSALLLGQVLAWWIPYLVRYEPKRAARYRVMFGNTYSFLPVHNGIAPNTAHVLLHLATAATLVFLIVN